MNEISSCGVGFVASLKSAWTHETLQLGLRALVNLEHRGGSGLDNGVSDGAGIQTDIPHELLGVDPGDAVANLFLPREPTARVRSLKMFEETFQHVGLDVVRYREVPLGLGVFAKAAHERRPEFLMAFIRRPKHCSTRYNFEKMLYAAKQLTRIKLREAGILKQFFFTSLSAGTIVYKALTCSEKLSQFYLDLQDPTFRTRFVIFHRRFSTNTATAWDTAQPFRVVAHNGEINTISGNRLWARARERALGLTEDELLTHIGISDSGSVNEMIEALSFRSSIPHLEDSLAILMPPANSRHSFYKFWSRAMEPWDGPALFTFSDGRTIGARLDRSGFRPCRWARTQEHFFLSSEAGSFDLEESAVLSKGSLSGSASVNVNLRNGSVHFKDASQVRENLDATFDPRLSLLKRLTAPEDYVPMLHQLALFNYTDEDIRRIIVPLVKEGKEGIGSMGDTARLAVLSGETRSLFDFFYQRFAQVTNPPLDYLREKLVTDMSVVLGRKPNIFEPKELLPLKIGIDLEGPVLTLGQIDFLKKLDRRNGFEGPWPDSFTLDTTFSRTEGESGFREKISRLQAEARKAVSNRLSVIILSDRAASIDRPAIPILLALGSVVQALQSDGGRLRASLVIESGEVKDVHHLAALIGFGASAVCPRLLIDLARIHPKELMGEVPTGTSEDQRERTLILAMESGLLKVMSKMGVSVLQSYQGAELFTILGLGPEVHREFFPSHRSLVGGLTLEQIISQVLRNTSSDPYTQTRSSSGLLHNYLYKEHQKQLGEKHSMTLGRSRAIHRLVEDDSDISSEILGEYQKSHGDEEPISFRHLLIPKSGTPLPLEQVIPIEQILTKFGSGGMSFGAISRDAQRDLILAMREIGGRSNSGEGGENPYYFSENISAQTKQVASGRFGVTAEYLVTGEEIQIKIAQGAKPGEGGQLMAAKVNADIAKARHADPNVNLISPPPMHDIYSIEDLKQFIFELRQLKPQVKISVKLVSGENIGTIAVGVVKAGADIIHVSGHDGGTGAATLSSMKHAGLPWEIGLWETHLALSEQGLRECVTLRVDGGLSTGKDVVRAAILGAEEFDFGKLLLVAEGCIMARVCEKNTCPTGIATHDPKFTKLYKGSKDRVIRLLKLLGEDIRSELSKVGEESLAGLVGRSDLLELDPRHSDLVKSRGLSLLTFFSPVRTLLAKHRNPFIEGISEYNRALQSRVSETERAFTLDFPIRPIHRAALVTLNGTVAGIRSRRRQGHISDLSEKWEAHLSTGKLVFRGSAGQGFSVFLQEGMDVRLVGEANDSVAKSMSGGKLVIVPCEEARYPAELNTIIGNVALYGATGGVLYVRGIAGNRFAVRNSGAIAVVEGVGMHACEYMTRGTVVILGEAGLNIGAGMTGGDLYLLREYAVNTNREYITGSDLDADNERNLGEVLKDYARETGSASAKYFLENWDEAKRGFIRFTPVNGSEPKKVVLPLTVQGDQSSSLTGLFPT